MIKSLLKNFLLGIITVFFIFGNGVRLFAENMEKTPMWPDTENYLEVFSKGDIESTMYNLFIENVENGKIRFYAQFFERTGTVVSEDRIVFWVNAELSNNKCDFTWTDTYLSTGIGSLEIYEDHCVINMQETKKSELALGNSVTMTTNGPMTLPSIMNKDTSYKKIQEFGTGNKTGEDNNTSIIKYDYSTSQAKELSSKTVEVTIGKKNITIDGEIYEIDVAPYIQTKSGSTMVPLRFVMIALGIDSDNIGSFDESNKVSYDPNSKTATMFYNNGNNITTIQFTAGSSFMKINGSDIFMGNDVIAEIIDGRMFIPFRAIGTAINVSVDWNAITKTAIYSS